MEVILEIVQKDAVFQQDLAVLIQEAFALEDFLETWLFFLDLTID